MPPAALWHCYWYVQHHAAWHFFDASRARRRCSGCMPTGCLCRGLRGLRAHRVGERRRQSGRRAVLRRGAARVAALVRRCEEGANRCARRRRRRGRASDRGGSFAESERPLHAIQAAGARRGDARECGNETGGRRAQIGAGRQRHRDRRGAARLAGGRERAAARRCARRNR